MQNNNNIDDPEVTTQTLGKLKFPPINPKNQSQGVEDDNADNFANLIQNEPETAPDCVEIEAAPSTTAPVTREQSTTQEIVVLKVEDVPVDTADDKFRVICPRCGNVVTKFYYASHKASESCQSLARPPEATITKTRQCDVPGRASRKRQPTGLLRYIALLYENLTSTACTMSTERLGRYRN